VLKLWFAMYLGDLSYATHCNTVAIQAFVFSYHRTSCSIPMFKETCLKLCKLATPKLNYHKVINLLARLLPISWAY